MYNINDIYTYMYNINGLCLCILYDLYSYTVFVILRLILTVIFFFFYYIDELVKFCFSSLVTFSCFILSYSFQSKDNFVHNYIPSRRSIGVTLSF